LILFHCTFIHFVTISIRFLVEWTKYNDAISTKADLVMTSEQFSYHSVRYLLRKKDSWRWKFCIWILLGKRGKQGSNLWLIHECFIILVGNFRTGNIEISESDVRLLELKYGSCKRNLYPCYGVSHDARALNYKNLLLKWSNDFTSLKPNNLFYFSEVLNNVLYRKTCVYFMLTRNLTENLSSLNAT